MPACVGCGVTLISIEIMVSVATFVNFVDVVTSARSPCFAHVLFVYFQSYFQNGELPSAFESERNCLYLAFASNLAHPQHFQGLAYVYRQGSLRFPVPFTAPFIQNKRVE